MIPVTSLFPLSPFAWSSFPRLLLEEAVTDQHRQCRSQGSWKSVHSAPTLPTYIGYGATAAARAASCWWPYLLSILGTITVLLHYATIQLPMYL